MFVLNEQIKLAKDVIFNAEMVIKNINEKDNKTSRKKLTATSVFKVIGFCRTKCLKW